METKRALGAPGISLDYQEKMKLKYHCVFNVKKFPFDDQICRSIFKINQLKPNSLIFVHDRFTSYKGLPVIDQFSVGNVSSKIVTDKDSTKYIIILPLTRISTSSLLNTFIPTVGLWLFGYSTLFIDPDYHINRFMGASTALLVTVTLRNAINSELPKTSYMKFVDLWFVWHVMSIFFISCCHISFGRILKCFKKPKKVEDLPYRTNDYMEASKVEVNVKTKKIDRISLILFSGINIIFYAIYFYVTLSWTINVVINSVVL